MGTKTFKTTLILYTSLLFLAISFTINAQVTVQEKDNQWSFYIDDKPIEVKGVTFGYDDDVENYEQYFKDLKYLGVNTIRTWGIGENTGKLLDVAHTHNIKVMLGIWMRHGKPGMEADDSFDYLNDTKGKEAMYENAISSVEQYKNHPAVLAWGVGNEVYLNTATDEEKIAYSKLLERICSTIKTIDTTHPIASIEAWIFGVKWWEKYVPSLDVYGINVYGAGANVLPEELKKNGATKPYVITEFGVRGEWEIDEDQNNVKPEPGDAEKYETIVKGYNEWIKPKPNCLGAYIFHYSTSDEFIGPWLLTHFKGMTRPQYWAIREAYTGQLPVNNAPQIESFELETSSAKSETWMPLTLKAQDKERENLEVTFYYNHRKGSRKRRNQILKLNSKGSLNDGFEIQLPVVDGGVKIYAVIKDTFNNAGIATTSISVEDKKEAKRKFLLPRAELPFYVYQDNSDLPYSFSAYMGNYQNVEVDLGHTEIVKSGENAIKISYKSKTGWYGLGFVDPANDWGDILGGYDIRGATAFSFWAKASYDNLKAKIGFGLIEGDKPYPDSEIELIEVELTRDWKKYSISTKRADLICIRSGFVIFTSGEGLTHEIYIDDIVFK
jgi:exo-beta-1,3-glucanase (GH17 family)